MTDHDLQEALYDLVLRCGDEGAQADTAAVLSLLGLALIHGRTDEMCEALVGFTDRVTRRLIARGRAAGAGRN